MTVITIYITFCRKCLYFIFSSIISIHFAFLYVRFSLIFFLVHQLAASLSIMLPSHTYRWEFRFVALAVVLATLMNSAVSYDRPPPRGMVHTPFPAYLDSSSAQQVYILSNSCLGASNIGRHCVYCESS